MKKLLLVLLFCVALTRLQAQTQPLVSFQFTLNPTGWEGGPVAGWINVQGDPKQSQITVTDPISHITISSVAAGNWYSDDGQSAQDRVGDSVGGTFFPNLIMLDNWYQYSTSTQAQYNAATPQLQLSGLNKDSAYILRMTASTIYDPTISTSQYTVAGRTVSPSQTLNCYNNTTQGVTFLNVYPDASGVIRVYVNSTSTSQVGMIAGLQVLPGSAHVGAPVVTFTKPSNGTLLPEGTNLTVTATATESGGSIAKVEFYSDTTKLATLTSAPYTFSWNDPDPGSHVLTAKATDNVGTIGSASITVGIESLNYFWSTTGNIATPGDSNFVGTVDSNKLVFRTKNLNRMTISAIGNIGIGVDSPTAQLHTIGNVRLAGLKMDSTNIQPRMLVSDTSGNLYYRNVSGGGVSGVGDGLGQTSTGISLGDSIPGPGPHSFNSNRYQYLNSHFYSIGGTVNDPVNRPAFRIYDNGDITAGLTMDSTVNGVGQNGLRFNASNGILQLGGSDNLRHNAGSWSSLLLNSDVKNNIKGAMNMSYVAGDGITIDTTGNLYISIILGENHHIGSGGLDQSYLTGFGHQITNGLAYSMITGVSHTVNKPESQCLNVSGYGHLTADTARSSIIGGSQNIYGGLYQLEVGNFLVNRTPAGAVLGNGNVDFTTLPYTGLRAMQVPGIANYPLLAVGNSNSNVGAVRSNALTVLFNGRTQINTTGHTVALSQSDVTPKAALDVVSTNTGVLLPRLTTTQRNAIVSGDLQNGLLLYNTDSSVFQYYNGSAWNSVGSGTAGGASGRWLFTSGTQFDTVNNVGIGTNNTHGFKLAVNGNAIFTKIKVMPANAWPDYVFKKEYKLPALADVEQYISKHQHLPDLPSAETVKKEGLEVGETQATLLKKVEELTLYVIDLNKKMETLQKENMRLSQLRSSHRPNKSKQTK